MRSHLTAEKLQNHAVYYRLILIFANLNIESSIKYTTLGSDIQLGLRMTSLVIYSDKHLIHMLI